MFDRMAMLDIFRNGAKTKGAGINYTKAKRGPKIFCISFQRTGTTSVGVFFHDHGFPVATWGTALSNKWIASWFSGDHERIFSSPDFKQCQVYEDVPWGGTDFYKVLFHRFPDARFILVERSPEKWFDSMVSHSNGKTLGNTHRHACIYNREDEFHALGRLENIYTEEIDNLLPLNESHRAHYQAIYTARNREARLFFEHHGKERLFTGRLEDADLWKKLGSFFSIPVKEGYRAHANASPNKG